MSQSKAQQAELGVGDMEKGTTWSSSPSPHLNFTGVNSQDEESGVGVGIRNGIPGKTVQPKKTNGKKYVVYHCMLS